MQNLLDTLKSANLKGKTIAIALILVLTMSSALVFLPAVNAQYTSSPTKGSNGFGTYQLFQASLLPLTPSVLVRQLRSS
jgi:hypothetical protein